MTNKRVYEVGEEFFDKDLGFKVRCVADGGSLPECYLCAYDTDLNLCFSVVCASASRRSHPECKTPVTVHFEKVEEDEAGNS